MQHDWELDEDGNIDTLAWDGDIHGGPVCAACGWGPCGLCMKADGIDLYATTCTGIDMVWPDDPFWGIGT